MQCSLFALNIKWEQSEHVIKTVVCNFFLTGINGTVVSFVVRIIVGGQCVLHNTYYTNSHFRITTISLLSYEIINGSSQGYIDLFVFIKKVFGVLQNSVSDYQHRFTFISMIF